MRRYVFVGSDMDFIKLQYMDFDTPNKGLILLNKTRRLFKVLSIIGLSKYRITDPLVKLQLQNYFAKIDSDEEVCFVIYSREYESYRTAMVRYLRKKYKNITVVVYYGDLVSRHKFDIEMIKKEVDMVFTFDMKDAQKYGLKWILEPFSSSIINMSAFLQENNPIQWDVTFVGNAKNRYDRIISLYEALIDKGLKCDFHITGVPENERKYTDNIKYERMDFTTLLQHVVASRCVAEVMQNDGVSPTTRYTEAMLFGKNLLTDCLYFKDENNRSQNVFFYSDMKDVDHLQISDITSPKKIDRDSFIELFSIDKMISSIDAFLEN